MKGCNCSIFDVREEQIFEPTGTRCIRLICNVCGSILDSKTLRGEGDSLQANRRGAREAGRDGGAAAGA